MQLTLSDILDGQDDLPLMIQQNEDLEEVKVTRSLAGYCIECEGE